MSIGILALQGDFEAHGKALRRLGAETHEVTTADGVKASHALVLPGGETELQGKDAAKRLIRMAPPFIRRVREEQVIDNTVILRGLTRSPGHFANFTTWTFQTDGDRIVHVSFAWRPAN